MEGLVFCGSTDKKWVLACGLLTAVLAGLAFLFGERHGAIFSEAAKMQAIAALLILIIFLMTKMGIRLHILRWVMLGVAMGLDIILGARYLVDRIF